MLGEDFLGSKTFAACFALSLETLSGVGDYVEGFETGMGTYMTDCFLFLSKWSVVPGTVFPVTRIRSLSRSQMFRLQMGR